MKRVLRYLLALARELSDETAYRRHLERSGAAPSAHEWRRFSDARLKAKFARAKCC